MVHILLLYMQWNDILKCVLVAQKCPNTFWGHYNYYHLN